MLGAYFKVDQRVRKAQISLEPCGACLRATLNAREIALEGTELDRSIPKLQLSISSAEEGCIDARYIWELPQHLTCTWTMLMTPLHINPHARKSPRVSIVKSPCTRQFALLCESDAPLRQKPPARSAVGQRRKSIKINICIIHI